MVKWKSHFYDPVLFDAEAGDADDSSSLEFYQSQVPPPPSLVADFGCGTGRMTLKLLSQGHSVIAIDESPAMLDCLVKKLEELDEDSRTRAHCILDSVLTADPPNLVDCIIAVDDFTTHFLSRQELICFFRNARRWLKPQGLIVTDLRHRCKDRLLDAQAQFPKTLKTFGISGCLSNSEGGFAASMRFWEEYEEQNRILDNHQVFDFIDDCGNVMKTVYKSLRQCIHLPTELVDVARSAGFALVQFESRCTNTTLEESDCGFFCFRAE